MRLWQSRVSGGAGSLARPWGAEPQPRVTASTASASAAPSLGGGGGGRPCLRPHGAGMELRHPQPQQEQGRGDTGVPRP